jgi:hypothetical protein
MVRENHKILAEIHAESSPDVVRMIKSRRVQWMGHVACMGEMRNIYNILMRKPKGKRLHGRPRCRWGIILEWTLKKQVGKVWPWIICLRIGTSGRLL